MIYIFMPENMISTLTIFIRSDSWLFLFSLILSHLNDQIGDVSQAQVHRGAAGPEGAFEPDAECRLWNRRLAEAHRFLDQIGQQRSAMKVIKNKIPPP